MNKHIDDLLPFYVNASLSVDQKEVVEAHLAGCIQCRKALRDWEDLAGWVRSAAHLPGQAGPTVRLPALSPVVRANLRGNPSFPEAVLSTARLIAAQRIFLKKSRLIQTLSAVLLASVMADLFLSAKYHLASSVPFFILVPFLPVLGMNCHMPEALALDRASGLKALSMNGSSASSVGMPRRRTSSTM